MSVTFYGSTVNLTNVTIHGNSVYSVGIAVDNYGSGHVIITDVTIVNNNLKHGVYLDGYSEGYLTNLSITNVNVNDNSIESEIFYVEGYGYTKLNNVTVANNTGTGLFILSIFGDTAVISLLNTAIINNKGSGLMLNCIAHFTTHYISNITVKNNKESGIFIYERCNVSFIDHPSTIANNYSPTDGGGM